MTASPFTGMTSAAAARSSCTGSAARASRTCGRAHSAGDRTDSARLRRRAKRKTKTSHSRRCGLRSGKTSGTTARGRAAPTSSGWTSSPTRNRRPPPPPPPLARTNLGAARPGRGPHGLRPRPRGLQRCATGQSAPHVQPAGQLGLHQPHEPKQLPQHRRHPHHLPPDRHRLADGGRGMGDGHRPRRPWRRVGGLLPPRRGHDPGGDREADGGLPHMEGHTPSTQPRIADTAHPAAAGPATTTGHIRQCSGGQDDGQRYPARRLILPPPENHRNHHHPPAPIPRHDSDEGHERTGPNVGRGILHIPRPIHLRPPTHPPPNHTNNTPPTPGGLQAVRHHLGPAHHRAPDKSVRPNGRRNDNQHNTTRPQGAGDA